MKKLLLLAAVALASCWFVAGCAHPVDAPVSVPHKTELMLDSLDVCAEAAPAPVVECAFHVGRQRQVMCMPSGAIMPSVPAPVLLPPGYNTEEYKSVQANRFKLVSESPLSTFGADVDTASYTMVRSHLQRRAGPTPPPDAIRIEELRQLLLLRLPGAREGAQVRRGVRKHRCAMEHGAQAAAGRRAGGRGRARRDSPRATTSSWSTTRGRWAT